MKVSLTCYMFLEAFLWKMVSSLENWCVIEIEKVLDTLGPRVRARARA